MKKVSGSLKLSYSQYRELQAFSQFGSDLDADTKARLAKGERIVEVLKQGRNAPLTAEHQVMIIFAVTGNYLKSIPVRQVSAFETAMLEYVDSHYPEIGSEIRETGAMKPETEETLGKAISEYVPQFLKEFASA